MYKQKDMESIILRLYIQNNEIKKLTTTRRIAEYYSEFSEYSTLLREQCDSEDLRNRIKEMYMILSDLLANSAITEYKSIETYITLITEADCKLTEIKESASIF